MLYAIDDEVVSVEPVIPIFLTQSRLLARAALAKHRLKPETELAVREKAIRRAPVSDEARRAVQEATIYERFDEELAEAAIDELQARRILAEARK